MYSVLTSNRFKSFYWYLGALVLSTVINAVLSNISLLTPYVSPFTVMLLAGVLQECSKAISNYIKGKDVGFVA